MPPYESKNRFTELSTIDSTNNYARELLRAGMAVHGEAIFAHEQTAGRGRTQKNWHTGKEENIALSIVLSPTPLLLSEQFRLSAAIALGVHRFFTKYAGNETRIKWPNDIYWRDRKAGGILIESIIGSNGNYLPAPSPVNSWQWAIAGIGININQTRFSDTLRRAVSLRQITGKLFSPIALAKELHQSVLDSIEQLHSCGFDYILEQYNLFLYKKGETNRFRKGTQVFEAVIQSVTPQGALAVEAGTYQEFGFDEIEFIL